MNRWKKPIKLRLIRDNLSVLSSNYDEHDPLNGVLSINDKSRNIINVKTILFLLAGATVLLVLFIRLMFLQVFATERYSTASSGNRIRDSISYAARGNIYDRNGKLLAGNTADFQITTIPYLLPSDESDRIELFQKLSAVLDEDADELKSRAEAKGIRYVLPIVLKGHVDRKDALIVDEKLTEFPGISVDVIPAREYVSDAGLAHVIGYTARVSPSDLESRDDIGPTDFIGRAGIEAQYDKVLRGDNGSYRHEVDALGRPLRLLAESKSKIGTDIHLTIDYDLQVELERQLLIQMQENQATRASAVVLEPSTGEVLAMVSLPYYDNNSFTRGISSQQFKALLDNPDKPLINRAISSAYPSGSTIKPLIASIALQEGVVDENTIIVDRGSISVANQYNSSINYTFRGWRPGGLGPMNVRSALAMSSNIYFYTVGGGHQGQRGVGANALTDGYKMFGLGEKSGIDLPGETSGRVPDPLWKQKVIGEPWYLGDTYNISIGQGDLKASIMQITLANMAIANDGTLVQPRLLKQVAEHRPLSPIIRRTVNIDKNNLQIVREGMRDMLYKGPYCACRFDGIPVEAAGKTGTAETDKLDPNAPPHGWFVSYAPYNNPEIMVGIMMEQGDKSKYPMTVGAELLKYYYANK